MKPINRVGVRFTDLEIETGFEHLNAGDDFNPSAMNRGVVVSASDSFLIVNAVNHFAADPSDPSFRIEKNGDAVCNVLVKNTWIKPGMEVICLWTDIKGMEEGGFMVDGVCYIDIGRVLFTIGEDGSYGVMPGCCFVERIPTESLGRSIEIPDMPLIPSIGRVVAAGSGVNTDPLNVGDIVMHYGGFGQRHVLPGGREVELLFYELVIASFDKSWLKGGGHGMD